MAENDDLLSIARLVNCRDQDNQTMNCAMIDCNISIVDFGKLVNSKKFPCWSYSDLTYAKLTGLIYKKESSGGLLHFTADKNFIMLYPSRNDQYNPQDLVDFFCYVRKKIDKNATLLTYEQFQKKHSDN